MKKTYLNPSIKVEKFELCDVLSVSTDVEDNGDGVLDNNDII